MALNIQQSIYTELADFLVSQPSLDALAGYKMPPAVQKHLDTLLEKNRDGSLSEDGRLELEKILAISHVMSLTKTKAQLKLDAKA